MWIVVLVLGPGVTMGLFAAEKANGTEELLMTSPITIWELVLGKYLAAAAFVTILTGSSRSSPGSCSGSPTRHRSL